MRDFHCPNCGQRLTFENSACLACGSALGFSLDEMALLVITTGDDADRAGFVSASEYELCANRHLAECNWLVPIRTPTWLCSSCVLTIERPNDADPAGLAEFARAEAAKRRLVAELRELKLPIVGRDQDPDYGLAFRLLSSAHEKVLTGHENGVITLDLAEGDDVHREQLRVEMDEPYRTLLGHFRHEIGHYYWERLVKDGPHSEAFRALFGDERQDYSDAVKRHYDNGPRADWRTWFVSAYASMHPWEDWAETWAHYLHMVDTVDTARAYGLTLRPHDARGTSATDGAFESSRVDDGSFNQLIEAWFPLTVALNSLNRSMGTDDCYPFVLGKNAVEKLRFVHDVVRGSRA